MGCDVDVGDMLTGNLTIGQNARAILLTPQNPRLYNLEKCSGGFPLNLSSLLDTDFHGSLIIKFAEIKKEGT